MRRLALLFALAAFSAASAAAAPKAREGWVVIPTTQTYAALLDSLKAAVSANGMGLVTQAGPTEAAKARGVDIPGNRVLGVFNNKFAVRMLAASESAMIEAPVRFYVTEEPDGTGVLSYKTPSFVFAPYADDGAEVAVIAAELDGVFAAIAAAAAK